jgi:hypothetical protein
MTLRDRSIDRKSSGRYSWDAISSIMRNVTGQEYTYDQYEGAILRNSKLAGTLENIVSDANERYITLVTAPMEPEESPDGGEADIQSSAKQAAKKTLDRP